MRKMIIVQVRKPIEEAKPTGGQPNEGMAQGISDVEAETLRERVASLCEQSIRVSNQVHRIMSMDGDEFDPETAVGLLQRIAVLDGTATVLTRKLEDVGFVKNAIQTCRGIRASAELMYINLKHRLSGEM